MPLLYLLDENISAEIALIGRRSGLDAVHMRDVLPPGVKDDIVLAYAASMNRCLVTADGTDFRRLSLDYEARGRVHAGIVTVRRPPPRTWSRGLAAALVRLAQTHPDGLGTQDFIHLPDDQIRPRRS